MKMYLVLMNSDFTEGRGVMVPHQIFDSREAAHQYIMMQPGIFGSKQRKHDDDRYNGYAIEEMLVLTIKDVKNLPALKEKAKKIEKQIKELQNELRLIEKL